MPLKLTPVPPIASTPDDAFPRYPETPEMRAFALLRRELEIRPAEAAKRLGISPLDVLDLESGRFACDWEEARRLLLL